MKINLITLTAFPYFSAESIHIAMFSKAMIECSDFELITPKKLWRPKTIFSSMSKIYGIKDDSIRRTTYLQFFKDGRDFLIKAMRKSRRDDAVVYCRQAVVASHAVRENLCTVWEQHSFPKEKDLNVLDDIIKSERFLKLVVITRSLKDDIIYHLGLSDELASKIIVSPDGADSTKFFCNKNSAQDVSIGYIGSAFKGKGIEVILPLVKMCSSKKFKVYGVSKEDLPCDFESSDNVEFMGRVPYSKVSSAINEFDIALLPNQPSVLLPDGTDIGKYTSPMKMFEYMAAGKAIVASDLPVLKEVLEHNKNCLLVKHDDILAWSEAVNLLENDSCLRDRIRLQANADFNEKYSYKVRCKNLVKEIFSDIS